MQLASEVKIVTSNIVEQKYLTSNKMIKCNSNSINDIRYDVYKENGKNIPSGTFYFVYNAKSNVCRRNFP